MNDPGRKDTSKSGAAAPATSRPWLEAGWLLAAAAVPLAVNLFAVQPFEPAKVAVLRTLAGCLVTLWLAGCLVRGRSPWRELRDHPLLLPALGVAGAFLLATVAAPDRQLSLWGSYERGQGLVTQLSYLLLFLVPAARLRTAVQARRLLAVMAATAVPLALLGAAQAAGWQIPGLLSDARSPVYGTLGRSNFLGAYLALLLPLTLALAATAHRRAARLALACLAVADLGLLALTQARAGWLAAVTGLAVFGLLLLKAPFVSRGRRGPGFSRRARGIAGVLLAGGVLAAAGLSLWLGRAGGSAAARLAIWRASLDLVARRPLTGWGPDGLGLAFPRFYPPELVYYQGRGIMVDRAHNLALDWLAAAGVVGLLAGAALFYVFFRAGLRGLRRQIDPARRTLLAGCLAAVAGALAGNLLAFDVTATASTTWLLMALLPALIADRPLPRENREKGRNRQRVAALLALPALVGIVGFNARPQLADVAAHTAALRAQGGDLAGAVAGWERAIALWPPEPAYRLSLAWLWLQAAERAPEEALPRLARAEAQLLAARDLRPGDFRTWAALGELYGVWGNAYDAARLAEADQALAQAAALAPNHATVYAAWGMIDLEGGRYAAAASRFRRAVELDETDGYAFAHLGDAELALGHVPQALQAYQQAVHWEPALAGAHLGLARCHWHLGHARAAAQAVETALALDPGNAAALALRRQIKIP